MKTAFLLATALLGFMYAGAQSRAGLTLMSFNIRFDNPGDGDNRWDKRRDDVAQTMLFHQAQVCGLQEVLHSQIQDLLQRMPGYAFVGVGRDDGQLKGEFSPILYDIRRLQLLDSGTFWLSKTPEKVSKGWDAALPRVATWAKLRDKTARKVFFVVNTHFDHIGQEARKNSAALIVQRVQHATLSGTWGGRFVSDHHAVMARVR